MGPKRGGGNRAGPKKTSGSQPAEISISDFVAAGDKNEAKKTKAGAKSKKKDAGGEALNNSEEPKKPSVRAVVGGASWTGKLPVNMLSEHCQKQKWVKPEYTTIKTPDGFLAGVILKKVNPKTNETVTLPPFRLPPSHKKLGVQPTAVEARHFAAAYTLFRVCNRLNLHMMMPPTFRDLWKDQFATLKADDVKNGNGWMYEADPFTTFQERNNAATELTRRKEQKAKESSKQQEDRVQLGIASTEGRSNGSTAGRWLKAPKIDMGDKARGRVEDLIRRRAIWNPYRVEISEAGKKSMVDEFTKLGFRTSHVEEALSECKDREEALEWLLIHIPEDDLPPWSLPEGYTAGITLASNDLVRESKIKRLTAAGYSADLCCSVLDKYGNDERLAAEALQHMLIYSQDLATKPGALNNVNAVWEEEHQTLEAIFDTKYKRLSENACQVTSETESLPTITYSFWNPAIGTYPAAPPVVAILTKEIPAYIRLSATRQAVQHALTDLGGEPMIFNIIDWLNENLRRILENPGKLRSISVESGDNVNNEGKASRTFDTKSKSTRGMEFRPKGPGSDDIRRNWEAKQSTPQQQNMLKARQSLPAWDIQDEILDEVYSHQVTIVSGETGSGKSTQCVQFILDDLIRRDLGSSANIVCTQPRRISALGLADRVSAERCSKVGDDVGYIIRGDSKSTQGVTKITFMTTGVLLRRLQTAGESVVEALADISHVVLDEVHERGLDTDFLLAVLREALKIRKDLKLILMSATLDANMFINYFGGDKQVGRVTIPGRTFPVDDIYLDDILRNTGFDSNMPYEHSDENEPSLGKAIQRLGGGINYDLISSTVQHIDSQLGDEPGGILIFLPGTMEIDRCLSSMRHLHFAHLLPLHASLLPSEQKRVFYAPPQGKRKVIAATNVAETSITIDDIVAVIDTGRVKETRYNPVDNIVRLEETWASQAACKQRRGRAGRVRKGTCYKLYTRNAEQNMASRPEPEIRRVPLEQLCLSVKAMRGIQNVPDFLANTLTPPDNVAVGGALHMLHRMGALDNDQLTVLGRCLSIIPADLRCAKLMVYGVIFGCIEACLTIAAILTVKSPFASPREAREEAKEARSSFSSGDGDLLTDLAAYQQWVDKVREQGYRKVQTWCRDNFLLPQTLQDISSNRAQLLGSLKDAALLPVDYKDPESQSRWNRHDKNTYLIRALISGAFNPQIASISFPEKKFAASMTGTIELDPEARTIKYFNQENGRVFVHPSSTLFDAQVFSGSAQYVSYFTKMATSKVFIRDVTPFNSYALLLFTGQVTLDTLGRGVLVDEWLRLRGWARIGVLISRLRMMLDEVLRRKIDNPGLNVEEDEVIEVVRHLVLLNGQDF
ncbi:putative ATP-dependent RNA helicase ucp12 [Microsporum ferrugineum]